MKKFTSILLAVLLLAGVFAAFPASAAPGANYMGDGDNSDFGFVLYDDNTAAVTEFHGGGSTVTIPEKIDGYTVDTIGDNAFKDNTDITKVIIPETVLYIGDYAFWSTNNLKTVQYLGSQSDWESKVTIGNNNVILFDTITYAESEEPGVKPEEPVAHEHEWSKWEVTKKATQDEDGVMTRECLENPAHKETTSIPKIGTVKISGTKFTYSGKAQKPTFTVKDRTGKKLISGTDYKIIYPQNPVNCGLYVASVQFKGNYEGLYDSEYSIVQAKNPLTATGLTKTVKFATLKKKNVTVAAVKVTKAQGATTYKKISGNSKITVNKTTGKFTVKKGLKKGTYKVKVNVTANGNKNYKSGSKDAMATIKVK